jgi:hypothetical protein
VHFANPPQNSPKPSNISLNPQLIPTSTSNSKTLATPMSFLQLVFPTFPFFVYSTARQTNHTQKKRLIFTQSAARTAQLLLAFKAHSRSAPPEKKGFDLNNQSPASDYVLEFNSPLNYLATS